MMIEAKYRVWDPEGDQKIANTGRLEDQSKHERAGELVLGDQYFRGKSCRDPPQKVPYAHEGDEGGNAHSPV